MHRIVWLALKFIIAQSQASDEQHKVAERDYWERQLRVGKHLNRITAGAAAVAIGGLIFVWLGLQETKRSTVEANRAWLGVTNTKFTRSIDSADGPEVTVSYNNVGRSPALDIRSGGTWTVMAATKPDHPETFGFPTSPLWAELDSQIRRQCLSVKPLEGGETAFPSSPADHSALAAPKPLPPLKNVIDQNGEILVAPGCLTYRSFGETRHTGFCRYAVLENGNWNFGHCPVGNFAE